MKKSVMVLSLVLSACFARAESAKDAWTKLVGPKAIKGSAFAYVENNAKLPNVFIYGDSISIGFTPYVRKEMEGKANVYRLYCNGGDSSSVIEKMEKMYKVMRNENLDDPWDFKWDVIQFNVGLHDLKYMKGKKLDLSGEQVSTIAEYKSNLEKVIKYFKESSPESRLVFAATTPVPANSGGRKEGDARKYNEAAMEVLKKYPEVTVNDLYGFTLPNQKKWWTKPGNVHFNPEGCKAQAQEVSRVVSEVLK